MIDNKSSTSLRQIFNGTSVTLALAFNFMVILLAPAWGFENELKLLSDNGYFYNKSAKMFVK